MKAVIAALEILFFLSLAAQTGCNSGPGIGIASEGTDNIANLLAVYIPYTAVKADILPLTEFVSIDKSTGVCRIRAYVSLLDSFESQIKTPGIFRFELYKYAERSPEPKGRRIMLWPDFDLTGPADNNRYWRDYLRAYRFNLEFQAESKGTCILQVTYTTAEGRRLSDSIILKSGQ